MPIHMPQTNVDYEDLYSSDVRPLKDLDNNLNHGFLSTPCDSAVIKATLSGF